MRYIYPATLLCDFYKISHREQYPPNTQKIYSTWTPRETRIPSISEVVAFGFQAFIQEYLIDYFRDNFFSRDIEEVVDEYTRVISATLGVENPDTQHIRDLHSLGYLPLRIRAVPEGTRVPVKVPMLTVENTREKFFWVTNYIETLMSCGLWQAATSATIAHRYRTILEYWAEKTGGSKDFVKFQGHDFSFRGMGSLESAKHSAGGHLLSFVGTDTIPGILFLEEFYYANVEKELIGTSIPATEHSVMCAYGHDEVAAYKNIITKVYPKGFVSIVSDTWNLWDVLNKVIWQLRGEILARDGKVVIRPDSGDPVKIICGDPESENEDAKMGVIQILWDIFGGITNAKGYKELDPHIGVIYGDAITLDRANEICSILEEKGFASTNMVYGIGSYTYQHNTRDTFGFALKSTYAKIDGKEVFLEKDPITDDGVKKSATGMVAVLEKDGILTLSQGWQEHQLAELEKTNHNFLEDVFVDGQLVRTETLGEIRNRLWNQ